MITVKNWRELKTSRVAIKHCVIDDEERDAEELDAAIPGQCLPGDGATLLRRAACSSIGEGVVIASCS